MPGSKGTEALGDLGRRQEGSNGIAVSPTFMRLTLWSEFWFLDLGAHQNHQEACYLLKCRFLDSSLEVELGPGHLYFCKFLPISQGDGNVALRQMIHGHALRNPESVNALESSSRFRFLALQ